MRFGLSDLQRNYPASRRFEALAREALGSDMGVAPTTEGSHARRRPAADTFGEPDRLTQHPASQPADRRLARKNDQLVPD